MGALKSPSPRGDHLQIHRAVLHQRNFRLDDVDLERHRLAHDATASSPRVDCKNLDLVLSRGP